jgi:hypothetical protein
MTDTIAETRLGVALKEWAVVQRALLEGHQLILLRKGGLIEETGDFDLRARECVLFPTYLHETERLGDIQPCFASWLRDEEANKPDASELRLECTISVTDIVRVDDRARLRRLAPTHIWSDQFIDGRYEWEPYKPVFVLVVRAYRLAEPVVVPLRQDYGGCRSWINLEGSVDTAGAVPAIGDDFFARRRELTLKVLAG